MTSTSISFNKTAEQRKWVLKISNWNDLNFSTWKYLTLLIPHSGNTKRVKLKQTLILSLLQVLGSALIEEHACSYADLCFLICGTYVFICFTFLGALRVTLLWLIFNTISTLLHPLNGVHMNLPLWLFPLLTINWRKTSQIDESSMVIMFTMFSDFPFISMLSQDLGPLIREGWRGRDRIQSQDERASEYSWWLATTAALCPSGSFFTYPEKVIMLGSARKKVAFFLFLLGCLCIINRNHPEVSASKPANAWGPQAII